MLLLCFLFDALTHSYLRHDIKVGGNKGKKVELRELHFLEERKTYLVANDEDGKEFFSLI